MRKTAMKRLACLMLSALICVTSLPLLVSGAEKEETAQQTGKTALQEISESLNTKPYSDYLEKYSGVKKGKLRPKLVILYSFLVPWP